MLNFVSKIILISLLNILITFAQDDLLKQKIYADSIFQSENYFDAIKEYKRLIFFDKDKKYVHYSLNQIALCYKFGGKLEYSYNYFAMSLMEAKSLKEIFDSKINICRLNIIENKTKSAHRLLDDLLKDPLFNDYLNEIKLWKGWAFFFEKDYLTASKIFQELNQHELYELSKLNMEQSLSVGKARILSAIIPGTGQIYSGNYLSGIGSFLWNIIAGYFTIKALNEDRILDGILLSNLLWLRFYRGNLENSIKFVEMKNQEIFNNSLIFLYKNYRDKIP